MLIPRIEKAPGDLWTQVRASQEIARFSKVNRRFFDQIRCHGWAGGSLVISYPQSCAEVIGRMLPIVSRVLVKLTGDAEADLWTVPYEDDGTTWEVCP